MGIVRFGEDGSDVYVFESERGLECCGCRFGRAGFTAPDAAGMIEHLLAHRAAGHTVPERALDELRAEAVPPRAGPG